MACGEGHRVSKFTFIVPPSSSVFTYPNVVEYSSTNNSGCRGRKPWDSVALGRLACGYCGLRLAEKGIGLTLQHSHFSFWWAPFHKRKDVMFSSDHRFLSVNAFRDDPLRHWSAPTLMTGRSVGRHFVHSWHKWRINNKSKNRKTTH